MAAALKEEKEQIEEEPGKLAEEWHKFNDARRSCSGDLAKGKRVITNGLRDMKRNHALGTLIACDAGADRWQVKLDCEKEPLKIHSQHMLRLSDKPGVFEE